MYTITHSDKNNPPALTKFLKLRVLCGYCNFKCCNSPSLEVETTENESKALELPRRFPQDGRCQCLTDKGCKHGGKRPVYCRLFSLQVTPDNKLVVSHWAILHCPNQRDYDFIETDENNHNIYEKKKPKSKSKNSFKTLSLKKEINKMPTVVEACKSAIVELWGEDFYKKALAYAEKPEPEGFGFCKK